MKKPTTSKKNQSKLRSLLANPMAMLPVVFAVVLGSVGTYSLMQSHALATIAPPTNLTVSATSPTSTQLYWWPSTASPAPTYTVYRDGVQIASVGMWLSLDGRVPYTDSGLTPGTSYTYYVQAVNSDGIGNSTPVTISTPVAPTANQLGTITGTVSGNRKLPIAGASVSIWFNAMTNSVKTAADGSYTITGVPAGSYSVGVSATGYKSTTARVNVVGGQSVNLPITLRASK